MKYETPELTPLMPAINAIQTEGFPKSDPTHYDAPLDLIPTSKEAPGAYADWE